MADRAGWGGGPMIDDFGEAIHAAGGFDPELVSSWPKQSLSRQFHTARCSTQDGRKVTAHSTESLRHAVQKLIQRLHRVRGTQGAIPLFPPSQRHTGGSQTIRRVKVGPGTMHHTVLRLLAPGGAKSARQLEGTHPYNLSPRNSWGQRIIELRAVGLVESAGFEETAGMTPAETHRITPAGLEVLDRLELGKAWTA